MLGSNHNYLIEILLVLIIGGAKEAVVLVIISARCEVQSSQIGNSTTRCSIVVTYH